MGFKVIVNDEVVWESDERHELVDYVSCNNNQSEFANFRPGNDVDRVIINVHVRNPDDGPTIESYEALKHTEARAELAESKAAEVETVNDESQPAVDLNLPAPDEDDGLEGGTPADES